MYSSGDSIYKLTKILHTQWWQQITQDTADTNDVISDLGSRVFGSLFLK